MDFFDGMAYNLRGFKLGLKTPRLLGLGCLRFAVMTALTIACAGLVLTYHQEILSSIWSRPESNWVVWIWHLLSWLLSIVLLGTTTVVSYLVSQVVFSVVIMDAMSRITEGMCSGTVAGSIDLPWFSQFGFLVKQEIPRAVIPIGLLLMVMVVGWITPLGPVITLISSGVAAVFLAWDNTDLVPARRFVSFGDRFRFLLRNLSFHLGFGILLLIPVINIALLSFAPIGATLYHCDSKQDAPVG
jgi:CysZ protein